MMPGKHQWGQGEDSELKPIMLCFLLPSTSGQEWNKIQMDVKCSQEGQIKSCMSAPPDQFHHVGRRFMLLPRKGRAWASVLTSALTARAQRPRFISKSSLPALERLCLLSRGHLCSLAKHYSVQVSSNLGFQNPMPWVHILYDFNINLICLWRQINRTLIKTRIICKNHLTVQSGWHKKLTITRVSGVIWCNPSAKAWLPATIRRQ